MVEHFEIPKFNNETLPEVVVLKIGGEVATDHVDNLRRQVSYFFFSHITQFLNFSFLLTFFLYMLSYCASVSYEGGGMRYSRSAYDFEIFIDVAT